MLHYIKLAIKKPYLIKDAIYKKHLGIILSCNIHEYIDLHKDNISKDKDKYTFKISKDVDEIFNYYHRMGRDSITKEKISKWLKNGHHCWLVFWNGKVIGGLWIFFGQIRIDTLSARVLSKNKTIIFDNNIGYKGYVIIDPKYRKRGIYRLFNDYIMKYYYRNDGIDRIVLITGASNGAVIKTIMKVHGKLIGIVEVRNILGKISRKEIFIDEKEKAWR